MSKNGIVDDIKQIIKKYEKIKFTTKDIDNIKTLLIQEYNISNKIIDEILCRILIPRYSLPKKNINKLTFTEYIKIKDKYKLDNIIIKYIFKNDNIPNCIINDENECIVPEEYITLKNHFDKLKLIPQHVQRSKEWFEYRHLRITASDTASAIDQNPYEPVEVFILKKCMPSYDPDYDKYKFYDNENVYHGKKYEPIATMIYEHTYDSKVHEFGALPSEKYTFLGASPDGICSEKTLNNKFSKRLGTMLEIKCPVTREINTIGKIIGDICPFYYYCQVQQQLLCCELDVCDFWQCKIIEYKNKEEYLLDELNDNIKKGVIIELSPLVFIPEFKNDKKMWKSKYLYPDRLDMNTDEYDIWILKKLNELNENDYEFSRIIYWKLDKSHNVSIKKDEQFMNNIIPILEQTWDRVKYYRNNLDKLCELKQIIDERKKYNKINTSYTIHNDYFVTNKILFLNNNYNCDTIIKTNKKKNISSYKKEYKDTVDFID